MSLPLTDALQDRLFVAINERFRREGVELSDRAPVLTAFLAALQEPTFAATVAQGEAGVAHGLLVALDALGQAASDPGLQDDLAAYVAYLTPRLTLGATQALDQMVQVDIPTVCDRAWPDRAAFYRALSATAFKVVDVYDALQTHASGNDLGQYFTPRHAVRMMASVVEALRGRPIDATDVVYDPAAGLGGFLVAALEHAPDRAALTPRLIGIEHTASAAHMARMNLWMTGGARARILAGSSLERDYLGVRGEPGSQTLEQPLPATHPLQPVLAEGLAPTVVLMNPPFPEDKRAYQSFEFVEHALKVMAEGGYLAALIPSVVVIGEDKPHQAFRARMLQHAQLQAVITLPPALFAPGASITTYLIVLKKRAGGHDLTQPVLFARGHEDGLDMDRGAGRRTGPRNPAEATERQWDGRLGLGGSLARLFVAQANGPVGTGWLAAHRRGEGHHTDRLATSACLAPVDCEGADWAPERFIEDHPDVGQVTELANAIASEALCAHVRQCFERHQHETVTVAPLVEADVTTTLGTLAALPSATLGDLFTFGRATVGSTKGWSAHGPIAVISASEQGNGVCGYTDQGPSIEGPALTVAKNGRPGIARVQDLPFAVTGDVAALVLRPEAPPFPRSQWPILAALIQAQAWRFNYGRKASEKRLLPLRLS